MNSLDENGLDGNIDGERDTIEYLKPAHWVDPANKLFAHQVGFTAPPHDFDAAPSDFLRLAPVTVGVHGRLLHLVQYGHRLDQRADNFHLLEEVVHCMADSGADVVGQVGTNWVHASGTDAGDIRRYCDTMSARYQTAFHMAGLTVVDALVELGVTQIALNSVYYWPDWRDGYTRFLGSAGLDVAWAGNFVDQGLYGHQQDVNDCHWIFPDEVAIESVMRTAEQAPDAEAIVVNGMPNWRRPDGIPERTVHRVEAMEAAIGKPIVSSDFALYWAIFRTLGIRPEHAPGVLLSTLTGER